MGLTIDLKGKTALVTGVSSGIGLGVASMLAKAGCDVAGCGKEPKDSSAALIFKQQVEGAGGRSFYQQVDVTKAEELESFVKTAASFFNGLDIVVSNAGQNIFEGVAGSTEEQWQKNIDLNITSHWRVCKYSQLFLEKSKNGVIIIMTSNHAFSTIAGCFPYNIAKTALTGLVRSMAIEWGPTIRAVGLAPGFIQTAGNDTWFNSFPDPEAERKRTIELHPVKRLGTVEDVGAFCAFLASDFAAFISGSTYLMDGGRAALMQDK
ncbi:MAG: hypothetical protein JWP78_1359 [Mucilaginibacter sp.]|nr:hypothetical protein [Mucilaginibacter sp.]